LPPTAHRVSYSSHYECATEGYAIAQEMMYQMGRNRVNSEQIVIGFKCEPKVDA